MDIRGRSWISRLRRSVLLSRESGVRAHERVRPVRYAGSRNAGWLPPPREYRYPLPILRGPVVVITPASAVGFGIVPWYAQGPALETVFAVEETATAISFTVQSSQVAVAFVGANGVVTVVHELVHGLVYRWPGYRVSYGIAPQLGAFYAAALHQFQRRNDDPLVGFAPLVVLDALLLPMLFVPVPVVAFAAYVALPFDTAGAAGDRCLAGSLLRMPTDTLTYDSDAIESYPIPPTPVEGDRGVSRGTPCAERR